jgi:hypothetical protein
MQRNLGQVFFVLALLGVVSLIPVAFAQGDSKPGDGSEAPADGKAAEDDGAKEEPQEPAAFKLEDKERKKLNKELRSYLVHGKKSREEMQKGLDKLNSKPIRGHSVLEDVAAFARAANACRVFGSKAGRPGSITPVKVSPAVHGFPGKVGTVQYWIRLPNKYKDKKLWPVIFCLPDTKAYPDPAQYMKDVWLKSGTVKDKYILVVPTPAAKGKKWRTDPISYARAMIALRHVAGTFEATRKTGGAASDYARIFLDGGDMAAIVGARFSEMFAGAVLRGTDGSVGSYKFHVSGGLNSLPVYCLAKAGNKRQGTFAETLKKDQPESEIASVPDPMRFDAQKIAEWMEGLPERGQPREIRFAIHDGSFQRHHWINVIRSNPVGKDAAGFSAVCDRITNTVTIDQIGMEMFEVSLNDALVDLNRDVRVVIKDGDTELVAWDGKMERDLKSMLAELLESNQPWRIYPARLAVDMTVLREAAAIEAAKKAADAAAAKKTEEKGASVEVTGGSLDR